MNDRAAPHLHGGLVPWPSDGGPFHWYNNPDNTGGPGQGSVGHRLGCHMLGGTDDYWLPQRPEPRFMWYHDHAVGLTRLNGYLGLATGYILTDDSGACPASGADQTLMAMLASRSVT